MFELIWGCIIVFAIGGGFSIWYHREMKKWENEKIRKGIR
jgi:hypothetical protein